MAQGRDKIIGIDVVDSALRLTREFFSREMDGLKAEVKTNRETISKHGEELASLRTEVKNLCKTVKNNGANGGYQGSRKRTAVVGGGTAAAITAIIYGILEVLGKL